MLNSAENLDFEKAAKIRDEITEIEESFMIIKWKLFL